MALVKLWKNSYAPIITPPQPLDFYYALWHMIYSVKTLAFVGNFKKNQVERNKVKSVSRIDLSLHLKYKEPFNNPVNQVVKCEWIWIKIIRICILCAGVMFRLSIISKYKLWFRVRQICICLPMIFYNQYKVDNVSEFNFSPDVWMKKLTIYQKITQIDVYFMH